MNLIFELIVFSHPNGQKVCVAYNVNMNFPEDMGYIEPNMIYDK